MSRESRGIPKQLRRVIDQAVAEGWSYESPGRSGHPKLRHPTGALVIFSCSPKDADTAARRVAADLKRAVDN